MRLICNNERSSNSFYKCLQNSRELSLSAVFVILVCFLEFVPVDAVAVFILAADLFADKIAGL